MSQQIETISIPQQIEIKHIDNILTLSFKCDIDAYSVSQFRDTINNTLQEIIDTKGIIINLKDVSFIDSHAVGLFVSILKHAHAAQIKLAFINVGEQPKSILKIVGFNEDIVCYAKDVNEALTLFDI